MTLFWMHELWSVTTNQVVELKWPYLHPVFGPPFTPYPLFQWYLQSKDILINLSMKCWNSAFNNAQGSRLFTVVVQLWTVKIYVTAVEAFRKKERHDETQFTTKTDGFLSFIPCWTLMYFFADCFWISPCVWPNTGFWCSVFLTLRVTRILDRDYGNSELQGSLWQKVKSSSPMEMHWNKKILNAFYEEY